jgi:pimeloyl-ACP methyl ester carboxylesterase
MIRKDFTFSSHGTGLSGTCWLPTCASPSPLILMVHPANQPDRSSPYYDFFIQQLPSRGVGFCVFDRRGSGKSGGDFDSANFALLADDVVSAVEPIRKLEMDISSIHLLGISQGGWIAPIAAAHGAIIDSLILGSACGVSPAEQMTFAAFNALQSAGYGNEIQILARTLRWKVDEYYRTGNNRQQLQTELDGFKKEPWFDLCYLPGDGNLPESPLATKWALEMDYDPLAIWSDVHIPALFLYAAEDEWVPVEESMMLYESAVVNTPQMEMKRLGNCDHLFYNTINLHSREIYPEFWKVMLNWLKEINRQ